MPTLTIAYGAILTLLGVAGYLGSGGASVTALIPAFFGVPLLLLGVVSRNERWRKHAMHGAAGLALIGLLGSLRGVMALPALLDGSAERPMAIGAQVVMAVLSLGFLVMAVRSFLAARRARTAS